MTVISLTVIHCAPGGAGRSFFTEGEAAMPVFRRRISNGTLTIRANARCLELQRLQKMARRAAGAMASRKWPICRKGQSPARNLTSAPASLTNNVRMTMIMSVTISRRQRKRQAAKSAMLPAMAPQWRQPRRILPDNLRAMSHFKSWREGNEDGLTI